MKGYNVSSLQCEMKLKDLMRRYEKGSKHNSKIRNKELGEVSFSPTSECSSLTEVKSNSILRNMLLRNTASRAPQVLPPQLPSCKSKSITPSSPTPSPLTSAPTTTRNWKLNKFKLKPARPESCNKHLDRLKRVKAILKSGNKHQGRLSRERLEAMENSVREFSQTMFSIFEKYMGNLRRDD